MADLTDWLTLLFTPGLGPIGCRTLLDHFGSIEQIFTASRKQLCQIAGLKPGTVAAIGRPEYRRLARRELSKAKDSGISLICWNDPSYPPLLKSIHDPPVLLYVKGDPAILSRPGVGLVGSRAASAYGMQMAESLGRQLTQAGFITVSGLALGIDAAAHRGTIRAGGGTIGVLGCGVDVIYPRQNQRLFETIAKTGALVSEFPLETRPEGYRFPARNRIISGLALGIVVVEAAKRSGSLITADFALEQGREVFAIPGRADSIKSEGAHRLLQKGAKLVLNIRDILEELAPEIQPIAPPPTEESETPAAESRNSEGEKRIMTCLDVYPKGIDEIIEETGLSVQEVNEYLLLLELKGSCLALPGRQYQLKKSA